MAKSFPTRNVGAPQASTSVLCGSARQIERRRSSGVRADFGRSRGLTARFVVEREREAFFGICSVTIAGSFRARKE